MNPVPYVSIPPSSVKAKLTFFGMIRSEWLKLFSLRSSYWVLAIFLVLTTGFTAIVVATLRFSNIPEEALSSFHMSTTSARIIAMLGTLVVGILGVLVITNEYSSGLIRSTFTAVPKRWPVQLAKAIVLILVAALVTSLSILFSYVIGYLLVGDSGVDFGIVSEQNPRILGGIILYVATMTLLGLAIGALIRHTAAAMATIVGIAFVLPSLADILTMVLSGADSITGWREIALYIIELLPTSAGSRLLEWHNPDAPASTVPTLALGPWAGWGVLGLWVLAFAIPALIRLLRRDA